MKTIAKAGGFHMVEMIQNITTRVRGMVGEFFGAPLTDGSEALAEELAQAKSEWVQAQNYFQNVTDPALVDHAVYLLEAAEAKYTYLLKQARSALRS